MAARASAPRASPRVRRRRGSPRGMLLPLLIALALGSSAAAQSAPKSHFSSRYTELASCADVEVAPEEEDWIYRQCAGLENIPVWVVCTDSARCRYGFGVRRNISDWFFGIRSGSAPIEWRGMVRHGEFTPFAAIIRVSSADSDDESTSLAVYRLRGNGTSCIVGSAHTNAAARRIADNSVTNERCEIEPRLL
jgi:hypothetical protein